MDVVETLKKAGVVPVIVIEDEAKAVPLARALVKGGLPVLEVTFRTKAAAGAIAKIKAEVPEAVVGAGTLLTPEQVRAAVAAGAAFGVAPGFDPVVVATAKAVGLPMVPGIATASELSQALTAGVPMVKFFPAEAAGGLAAARGSCRRTRLLRTTGTPSKNLRRMPPRLPAHADRGAVMEEEVRDSNVAVKVVCAVVLAAIVVAADWQLSVGREELVSANCKLADELRQLREVGRARATDKVALERERAAWKAERESLSGRLATAEVDLKAAREAQSRAEAEVAGLKVAVKDMKAAVKDMQANVKDMKAVEKKLRVERDKFRIERDRLEKELNEAMEPAMEADDAPPPATLPAAETEEVAVPPAPDLNKLTPEERAAHEKKELNDLIGL